MTEPAAVTQLIDFHNMPLTNEQQILAALLRIEVLLTPKQPDTPKQLEPIAAKTSKFGRK